MKKINSFYVFTAVLFSVLFVTNTHFFKGSKSFLGVTYSKVYKINTEKDAIIKAIYVVPGQAVETGDILVELDSPELDLKINTLKKEKELMISEKEEKEKLLSSEIQLLEAEKSIIRGDIENDVRSIQNEITLNRNLANDLLKNKASENPDSITALQLRISSIQAKGKLKLEALDIKIQDVKHDHKFDQSQLQSKIELVQEELAWKLVEKSRLNKYAAFPGVIGNVYEKQGEQIEAFSPIISINPKHPSSVVGYLVGKKDRDKKLGERVVVRSLEQPRIEASGTIIGFGSVVEIPDILERDSSIKTFGLEVFIEIPEKNNLAVGEKIIVK